MIIIEYYSKNFDFMYPLININSVFYSFISLYMIDLNFHLNFR
jgi:hypothetical protein